MTLLLDASVWIAAVDLDDEHHVSARTLVASADRLAALDLTVYEVANSAIRRWGSSAEAERLARLVLVASANRLVRVDVELIDAAAGIASEHAISVYDAAYVAAARRDGSRLISLDLADLVGKNLAEPPDSAVA